MKLLARLALLGGALLSQTAWADTGPYYVSYPGYCNVKKVYINTLNDIYGTEVGCASILGAPVVGTFAINGSAMVSTISNGVPCMHVYGISGYLIGGCSSGGPITYGATITYNARQELREQPAKTLFVISSEMPDLEKTKDLPPGGF